MPRIGFLPRRNFYADLGDESEISQSLVTGASYNILIPSVTTQIIPSKFEGSPILFGLAPRSLLVVILWFAINANHGSHKATAP